MHCFRSYCDYLTNESILTYLGSYYSHHNYYRAPYIFWWIFEENMKKNEDKKAIFIEKNNFNLSITLIFLHH